MYGKNETMKFTEQIKQKTPVEFELAMKYFFEQFWDLKKLKQLK